MKKRWMILFLLFIAIALPVSSIPEKKENFEIIVLSKDIKKGNNEKIKIASNEINIKRTFSNIDGYSGTISAKQKEIIKKDPNLLIFEDKVLKITPEPSKNIYTENLSSAELIGAIYAQDFLNLTGKNITVAVLDTGIDYTHSDFGSCESIGQGCRIIGGYDFVNNDPDPIDDHGHGTHVAGIIGANGTLRSIAPSVNFLAVKVCSASGSCATSDIIAGIDWAISNGADIIQMSIGGPSYPNNGHSDASSIVSDFAVSLGKVVVISAGNEGPGTNTIGTPGDAQQVITVGASQSNSAIPDFSSRGPSAFGRLDPDIVAPGYDICSTKASGTQMGALCIDNFHVMASGTSMAAPHISGAAALLLEWNHSLTPLDVRRLLLAGSKNVTASVFDQGAGVVNITNSITANIRSTLNGNDRLELAIIPGFSSINTLTIENLNNFSVNASLFLEDISDHENINHLSRNDFSFYEESNIESIIIGSKSQKKININITITNNASPSIYGTALVISSNEKSIRIPIIITVPAYNKESFNGEADNSCSGCWGNIIRFGDWLYYLIKSNNGTALTINLNWTNTGNDYDLYLFSPDGNLIDTSGAGNSESEKITLSSVPLQDYWLAVHAYSIGIDTPFNVTIIQGSNLSITPSIWQGSSTTGKIINITFTIKNDNFQKNNISISIAAISENPDCILESSINNNGEIINVLNISTCANNIKYLNATLRWANSSNDLDMYFQYFNSIWQTTPIYSSNNNTLLNLGYELIDLTDIEYYSNKYPETGIGIKKNNNNNNQNYTLTLTTKTISKVNYSTAFPAEISVFSPQQEINITIIINTTNLIENSTYDLLIIANDSNQKYSMVPIRIKTYHNDPPVIDFFQPAQNANIINISENATINFNQTSSDPDNIELYYYWYKNSALVSTNASWLFWPGYNDSGNFSIKFLVSDGFENDSVEWNITVLNTNQPPIILGVFNVTVNETQIARHRINATDYDNDSLTYQYSSYLNSSGEWLTNINDSGEYTINFTISDNIYNVSGSFKIIVLNLFDHDNDNIPDIFDNDDDNDQLNDDIDKVLGTAQNINSTSLTGLGITINNSSNISQVFNETLEVVINSNNQTIVNFEFDFQNHTLDTSQIIIEKQSTNNSGWTLIQVPNIYATKTIYIDKINSSVNYLCIKDSNISNITSISQGCNQDNETAILCPGIAGSYSCTLVDNETRYKISGLRHSGIREQCKDSDNDGRFILGCGNGDDCNDNDANINPGKTEICGDNIDNDCDGTEITCALSSGGGSGGAVRKNSNLNNSSINTTKNKNQGIINVTNLTIEQELKNKNEQSNMKDNTESNINGVKENIGSEKTIPEMEMPTNNLANNEKNAWTILGLISTVSISIFLLIFDLYGIKLHKNDVQKKNVHNITHMNKNKDNNRNKGNHKIN